MDKYAVVDKLLLRGSCPSGPELKVLRDICDVRRILSLDDELGKQIAPHCKSLNIPQIIVPLTDGDGENIDKLYSEIIPLLLQGPKTYVHCRHGKDRTGMVSAMYRLARGWPLEKALQEAHDFGMGQGMRPSQFRSYYRAVSGYPMKDVNEASDIVQQQRQELSYNPGINDQSVPNFGRESFAPMLDVQVDHLSRPASSIDSRLISLSYLLSNNSKSNRFGASPNYNANSKNIKVLANNKIYTKSKKLLQPKQFWYNEPPNGEGKLYSAEIDFRANVHEIAGNPNKQALQNAILNEYDVMIFSWKYYYVINPNALINIQEEEDVNNVPLVGELDNYTGQAQNVFPGTSGYGYDGGVTGPPGFGHAGFAGFIFGPNNGTQM